MIFDKGFTNGKRIKQSDIGKNAFEIFRGIVLVFGYFCCCYFALVCYLWKFSVQASDNRFSIQILFLQPQKNVWSWKTWNNNDTGVS